MIIAIDFDNTIVESNGVSLQAVPGAVQAIEMMQAMGHEIIIHTCRTTIAQENGRLQEELDFIADILLEIGLDTLEIAVGGKPIADLYIDDRGLRFDGDWGEVMKFIGAK